MADSLHEKTSSLKVRGHPLSFRLRWGDVEKQLVDAVTGTKRCLVPLPVSGSVLALRCQAQLVCGSVVLVKHLEQAKVRAEVVVQLIQLLKSTGHPDFTTVDMVAVKARAKRQLPSIETHGPNGCVPPEVMRFVDVKPWVDGSEGLRPDKNATPSEPPGYPEEALSDLPPDACACATLQRH